MKGAVSPADIVAALGQKIDEKWEPVVSTHLLVFPRIQLTPRVVVNSLPRQIFDRLQHYK